MVFNSKSSRLKECPAIYQRAGIRRHLMLIMAPEFEPTAPEAKALRGDEGWTVGQKGWVCL